MFSRSDLGVDIEGFSKPPHADVLAEASRHGFAKGVGEGPPAKVFW